MYKVQSILFRKKLFSLHLSKEWLKKHHYKDNGVDDKPNFYRFRQLDPKPLEKQGYHFITKKLGKTGVELIIAYKDALKGGKISAEELEKFLHHSYSSGKEFGDWKLDRDLSDSQVQVYHNAKGEAVVVHRGSKDVQDWAENALYALGFKSGQPRLEHSKEVQKKAEAKYGSKHVSTIGHSKGAYHAEEVGQNSKEIVTLNKPVTPNQIFKSVPEKQTDIRSALDPVSILRPLQSGKKSKTIKAKTLNPITEHGVSILKRLKSGKMFGAGAGASVAPRLHFEGVIEEMRELLRERRWNQNSIQHFILLYDWLRTYILDEGDFDDVLTLIHLLEDVVENPHIENIPEIRDHIRRYLDIGLIPTIREDLPPELEPETKEGSGRGREMCLYCV
jgi:hypothetical protein